MELERLQLYSKEAIEALRSARIFTFEDLYNTYGNDVSKIGTLSTDPIVANELVKTTELVFAKKLKVMPSADLNNLQLSDLGLSRRTTEIFKVRNIKIEDVFQLFMEQGSEEPDLILPEDVREEVINKLGILMERYASEYAKPAPEDRTEELAGEIESVSTSVAELETDLMRKREEAKEIFGVPSVDVEKEINSLNIADFNFSERTMSLIADRKLNVFQVLDVYYQAQYDRPDTRLPEDVREEIVNKVGAVFEYYTTISLAGDKSERLEEIEGEIESIQTQIGELLTTLDKLKAEAAELMVPKRKM